MKKNILYIMVLPFLLISCKKEDVYTQELLREQSKELISVYEGENSYFYAYLEETTSDSVIRARHYPRHLVIADTLFKLREIADTAIKRLPNCNRKQALELYVKTLKDMEAYSKENFNIETYKPERFEFLNDAAMRDIIHSELRRTQYIIIDSYNWTYRVIEGRRCGF